MAFRLWCGLAETEAEYRAKKLLWMPIARESLHDVLWRAMRCHDLGEGIAWEIEGDDGTKLNRQQIAEMVRLRRSELTENPPRLY